MTRWTCRICSLILYSNNKLLEAPSPSFTHKRKYGIYKHVRGQQIWISLRCVKMLEPDLVITFVAIAYTHLADTVLKWLTVCSRIGFFSKEHSICLRLWTRAIYILMMGIIELFPYSSYHSKFSIHIRTRNNQSK